jgi:PD-(D/E)XK nuclease superfamily protein
MGKEFSWSFSRLDGFETCPKRYYEINVAKSVKEDKEDDVGSGLTIHSALADYLKGVTPELPVDMRPYQKWADAVKTGPGKLYVEQRFALTRGLEPAPWTGNNAWVRIIGDAVRIAEPVALGVDWKSGRIKANSPQLAMTAQAIFSYWPKVDVVRTEFVWLGDDKHTQEIYRRGKMANVWGDLFPRVAKLERAMTTLDFPPKPGGLCKRYCPVTSCIFHGKGTR